MGDESPEKLVDFVRIATDSVKHALKKPLSDLTTSTPEKPYTRRRLKKGLSKTTKKLNMERQHRAQQYEVQEMYTSSMLNAAPICFGDNTELFGILNGTVQERNECVTMTSNMDGINIQIPSSEQFLDSYIPNIGSPRENMPLSQDIYEISNNAKFFDSQCMYERTVCNGYMSPPTKQYNHVTSVYDTQQCCYITNDVGGYHEQGQIQQNDTMIQFLNDDRIQLHHNDYIPKTSYISPNQHDYRYSPYEPWCQSPNETVIPNDIDCGNADLIKTLVDEDNLNTEALEDILSEIETSFSNSLSPDSFLSGFNSDISSDMFTMSDDWSVESSKTDSGLSIPSLISASISENDNTLPSFMSTFQFH